MKFLKRFVTATTLSICVAMFAATESRAGEPTLKSVQQKIEKRYPEISHLAPDALAEKLAGGEKIVLFDVREADEFAVSRIPGAVRVDPGSWSWSFLKRYAHLVAGKKVVFYCSVGVRSTRLAASVRSELLERGAKSIFNLRGGVFAWHNERRRLADDRGATDYVHPFDETWGRLVERKPLVRYTPGQKKPDKTGG